jgi:signal transduction histidine kinase
MKWLPRKPLQAFAVTSLVLVAAMVVAVSLVQSRFFRDAVIERESVIVHDLVVALAQEYLSPREFDQYDTPGAKKKFSDAFISLTDVSGVVRIKVYNDKNIVVWSDDAAIIGHFLPKTPEHIAQMWAGRPSGIFDPVKRPSFIQDNLPDRLLIEFYVPVTVQGPKGAADETRGVVAVYRKADSLVTTLQSGSLLLSSIVAIGGTLLFFALFHLFRSVHRLQREAESQFARLSSEHEGIVQMEKLSAIGHMLTEIAHQFNNPLVGVINLSQLAEREADNPERVRELAGKIHKAGHHCSDFVQRMLRFGQLARCELQTAELGGLVRDTIAFFAQSAGKSTPVECHAPDSNVVIEVDPVLIRHALFNLINNAAQANPSGPIIVSLAQELHDGAAGWAISVCDHGPGLSPEVAAHLFTPFFSTRQGGTGLGLPVAHQIVVQHGGRLRAENKTEGGARFVIWLPATREKYEAENSAG